MVYLVLLPYYSVNIVTVFSKIYIVSMDSRFAILECWFSRDPIRYFVFRDLCPFMFSMLNIKYLCFPD